MDIIPIYDSSVDNAPAGFKVAVQAAIDFFDQTILDPVSVKITFSYGEIEGQAMGSDDLGESDTNGSIEPYSQVVSWLTSSASSQADAESIASLPASDPTHGDQFWVSDAQAAVFGAGSQPHFMDPEDGFVALSSTAQLTYDPTDRSVPGEYDAIGILEHEITEALGRTSDLGQREFDGDILYTPMDLFRYASAGVHNLRPAAAYFSVDGQNLLLQFNNPRDGGDGGDWATSVTGDSFDAFTSSGAAETLSPTDLLLMDVLGFKIASPAPDDFNDDQKSDLLIENTAGVVVVGEVGSSDSLAYSQVAGLGPEWSFHGAGDFLGDGHLGFLIESTSGAVVVGEVVDDQTSYTQVAALGPEWSFHGAGDFLGDGVSDFLIENTDGALAVGEATDGQATYTQVASLGPEWKFVGVGDFMDDGKSDFLIENPAGAVVFGEVVNGQAAYTQVATLGPEWSFEGAGDFLSVGYDQFLIENTAGIVDVGEIIDGQAHFTQVAALGPEWKFVGTGDFLGEGHDQFLIENTSGAVVVGDYTNGQIHFTDVGGLGSEWAFHL